MPKPLSEVGFMQEGRPVKRCAILTDPREPAKRALIKGVMTELMRQLQDRDIEVHSFFGTPVPAIQLPPDLDLFIVLGGDGTMIHFAARLSHHQIPFYGLNYGNVGFMMNNPAVGLAAHAGKIASGEFISWSFPVLTTIATDIHGANHHGVGLNDIYLQRMTPQSCKVDLYLRGQALPINPLLCDGVIVATPLGSTAYSYNVTGSMVAIDTQVLTLTPVAAARYCPVSCMMLALDTPIRIEIHEPEKRRVMVVTDGQNHENIARAEIQVARDRVRLCFDRQFSEDLPMRFINKACEWRVQSKK